MAESKNTKKNSETILRMIISAFEPKALDLAVKEIISNTDRLEVEVKGPVPLPTKTKK